MFLLGFSNASLDPKKQSFGPAKLRHEESRLTIGAPWWGALGEQHTGNMGDVLVEEKLAISIESIDLFVFCLDAWMVDREMLLVDDGWWMILMTTRLNYHVLDFCQTEIFGWKLKRTRGRAKTVLQAAITSGRRCHSGVCFQYVTEKSQGRQDEGGSLCNLESFFQKWTWHFKLVALYIEMVNTQYGIQVMNDFILIKPASFRGFSFFLTNDLNCQERRQFHEEIEAGVLMLPDDP